MVARRSGAYDKQTARGRNATPIAGSNGKALGLPDDPKPDWEPKPRAWVEDNLSLVIRMVRLQRCDSIKAAPGRLWRSLWLRERVQPRIRIGRSRRTPCRRRPCATAPSSAAAAPRYVEATMRDRRWPGDIDHRGRNPRRRARRLEGQSDGLSSWRMISRAGWRAGRASSPSLHATTELRTSTFNNEEPPDMLVERLRR